MQTATPSPSNDPIRVVLDICRRVTLMEPLVARFDAIPMMSPIERVKVAATVVIEAAEAHECIRALITATGCLSVFQKLAHQRAAGGLELPQLKADLPAAADHMRKQA